MQTNPFPAILLAGPPESGKSVLSFLLSASLHLMNTPHSVLRAVPDNEDNWYQGNQPDLQFKYKHRFSAKLITQIRREIERRRGPLLVDIGVLPHGEQLRLIEACSHSILLYRETTDCAEWQRHLANAGLLPVAELQSQQAVDDRILSARPVLAGIISGLERAPAHRKAGATFGALLDRVVGICAYEESYLARLHRS